MNKTPLGCTKNILSTETYLNFADLPIWDYDVSSRLGKTITVVPHVGILWSKVKVHLELNIRKPEIIDSAKGSVQAIFNLRIAFNRLNKSVLLLY